jgi:hypothetical protein
MSLIAFHKFLIATAIVFCFVFAIRQLSEFKASGDGLSLLTAIAFGIASAALTFYLRHLQRVLKLPTGHEAFGLNPRTDPKGFAERYLRPAEPPTEAAAVQSAGNAPNRLVRWAQSLVEPQKASQKTNGHNGEGPT